MKTIRNIWLNQAHRAIQHWTLVLVIISLLCMPLMIAVADAQNHANRSGWHNAISHLAEKKNREEQQKAQAQKENKMKITVTTVIADDNERERLQVPVNTNGYDKVN